jgi:predicted enzyme related to lactoylglutathione lyase
MVATGVDFVSLPSRDVPAAIAFYEDVLGLPCAVRYSMLPGAEFETGNVTLQIIDSAAIGLEFSPNAHPIALGVDDVAAARAELEERGVRFIGETIDSGVCHMAPFADPDGNALMLHHRYAPRESVS